jgi:hypothetical protein
MTTHDLFQVWNSILTQVCTYVDFFKKTCEHHGECLLNELCTTTSEALHFNSNMMALYICGFLGEKLPFISNNSYGWPRSTNPGTKFAKWNLYIYMKFNNSSISN